MNNVGINTRYITDLISLKRNLNDRIDEEIKEKLLHKRGDFKKLIESLYYRIEEDARFLIRHEENK